VKQVTGTVRWHESVLWMRQRGVERLVEAGAGKVLAGLAKRIDGDLAAVSLHTPADIEAFLK
jgi:[acyl-carrier-protein] S-malonyltransferase